GPWTIATRLWIEKSIPWTERFHAQRNTRFSRGDTSAARIFFGRALINFNWLGDPFDVDLLEVPLVRSCGGLGDPLTHEQVAGLRRLHQARRQIGGAANRHKRA